VTRKAPGWRWQDEAAGGGMMDEIHPKRRVFGLHDIRWDGISDLLLRAEGASVIDIGCNRAHVAYDFAMAGARIVHGCDLDAASIQAARIWFAEVPHVDSQFEVVDLEEGPESLAPFGLEGYDIVLFLGVYHKLKRAMPHSRLSELVQEIGRRTVHLLGWTGYAEDVAPMDRDLAKAGLTRVHTSELGIPGRPAAIWRRPKK
jgi:SAM-dependent methyltransferase